MRLPVVFSPRAVAFSAGTLLVSLAGAQENVPAVAGDWDLYGIAAVLGALAWIPIVFQWGAKHLLKPRLDVVLGDTAEVGYTTYLGVCNVQAAIRVHRKPALITSIALLLVHENGRRKEMLWNGISEVVSVFEGSAGERGAHTRVMPAVALQVRPDTDLWQRKVQLNDRTGGLTLVDRANALSRRIELLGPGTNIATVRTTDEYNQLRDHARDTFFWESGTYSATMTIVVHELKKPVTTRFEFSLSQANVNSIRSNLALMIQYIDGLTEATIARTAVPPLPSTFFWVNPPVRSIGGTG